MLQIISPDADQAANLAHSRVGLSGSTRTERPVALGSLSLLDDEHLSSPIAKFERVARLCGCAIWKKLSRVSEGRCVWKVESSANKTWVTLSGDLF